MLQLHRSLSFAAIALPQLSRLCLAFAEAPSPWSSSKQSTMRPTVDAQAPSLDYSNPDISSDLGSNSSASPSPSLHDMVPITFELLRDHYARFPSPSINPELETARKDIAQLRNKLVSSMSPRLVMKVNDIVAEQIPTGLDNSMYSLRCACEEGAARLKEFPSLRSYAGRLLTISKEFEEFQANQHAHVTQLVNSFLPHDFRATLFNAARQHGERSNASALKELMASGGTVRDKYKLLWDQQWKRRETLAGVGNATGIWRYIIKYLAGVPEPLLQFAKEINSPKGPTEAIRTKFGSALSVLTRFAIELNALTATLEPHTRANIDRIGECLQKGLTLYEPEVRQFVRLLEIVITNSPFFVKPEQVVALPTERSD